MKWKELDESELDFLFEQLRQGKTADEIVLLRSQERESASFEKGMASEQKVIDALKQFPFVENVIKGNPDDDKEGNDLWVFFKPDFGHKNIPIQVKSSWTGFWYFRSRQEKGERRIIILVKPETSNTVIKRIFLSKLQQFDGFI